MRFKELADLYSRENKVQPNSEEYIKKSSIIAEKVAFYFKQKNEEHEKIIKENPMMDFKDIVEKIKESKIVAKEEAKEENEVKQEEVENKIV